MSDAIIPTYARLPLTFVKGEGVRLWDDRGEAYLDSVAGIAVCNLGHCHPAVTATIQAQAATLMHTSNLYHIPAQQTLAEKLVALSGMEKVFIANTGAEANEACIKIARKYGNDQGISSPKIIVMEHSFHGRTMATLSATGNAKVQNGFAPLVTGFLRVPYGDIDAIKTLAANHDDIVAIHFEPIAGEGGIVVPPEGFLSEVRSVCDDHQWLMMLDEVQTGIGRTGKWFAFQHENVIPDVMALAKGLGNGMPIGAVVVAGKATNVLGPGNHGSTFGGNPLACSVANTVLTTIENDQILANVNHQGDALRSQFKTAFAGMAGVTAIKGKGLMIGIELDRPCIELVTLGIDKHILLNVTAGNTIRFIPPLIINDAERAEMATIVIDLVSEFLAKSKAA